MATSVNWNYNMCKSYINNISLFIFPLKENQKNYLQRKPVQAWYKEIVLYGHTFILLYITCNILRFARPSDLSLSLWKCLWLFASLLTRNQTFSTSSCTKIYVLCIYTLGCFTTKSKMLPYIAHGTSICSGVYGLIYSDTEWFSITVFEKEFQIFLCV